ncbi:hypothetical protein AVEN_262718-1 [Araneus ventricosus]|uniref:Uncharacterized protein n=1 Tax=Araneus ventricosus TaxID=182803 RepID=A0A4Y2P6R7_ARAVE|nr:hypothetical protein AVEN_262718-1 [Araneus ventricosus]
MRCASGVQDPTGYGLVHRRNLRRKNQRRYEYVKFYNFMKIILQMCAEYCQLNRLLEMGKCIDKNVDYPHEFQLCTKNVRTLTSDIVKNCTLKCRDACYDYFYDVQYEKIGNLDHTCIATDEWCKRSRIKLTIVFNKSRLTRFVYQPKFAVSITCFIEKTGTHTFFSSINMKRQLIPSYAIAIKKSELTLVTIQVDSMWKTTSYRIIN